MKDKSVKSEYKLHNQIVYFDKNIENQLGNKYLLSLGYDDRLDQNGQKLETALIFKIWDFGSICTDVYLSKTDTRLTGGTIWEKNPSDMSGKHPHMFKIEVDGQNYV